MKSILSLVAVLAIVMMAVLFMGAPMADAGFGCYGYGYGYSYCAPCYNYYTPCYSYVPYCAPTYFAPCYGW